MAGFVVDAPAYTGAEPFYVGGAPDPRQMNTAVEHFIGGLKASSGGLAARGKLAEEKMGEDAPWYHRAAYGLGGIVGDLPAMVAGGVAGGIGGAAVSGPAAPIGGLIGAGAGSFAAPMALREALMEAYNVGHAVSWQDASSIALAALKGGTKGAVIGAVTGGAGAVVGRTLGSALAPAVGQTMTGTAVNRVVGGSMLASELATLTAASAAVEGHMPTAQDFLDNAILLGGMKAAGHTAKALRNVFAETGKPPGEVLSDALGDPKLKAELEKAPVKGETPALPPSYAPLALEQRIQASLNKDARPADVAAIITDLNKPLELGKPPIQDAVRLEYVVGPEEYKGLLRLMADKYGPEIENQRRGTRTHEATIAEARDLAGLGLAPTKIGDTANAAEMLLRTSIVRAATIDVATKAKEIAALEKSQVTPLMTLELNAAIERLSHVQREANGLAAEWGRAGEILRAVKRDPTLLGDVKGYLDLVKRRGDTHDLATLLSAYKDPAQHLRFADEYVKATTLEKVIYAWKAGTLSGILSTGANLFGNVGKMVTDLVEAPISASKFALDKAAEGDPLKMVQYRARAFAPLTGIQMGFMDGLKHAWEVLKQQGDHLERLDIQRSPISTETIAGKAVNMPYRVLAAQDALFRTMAERSQSHVDAVDRAVKEGFAPGTREYREAVVNYTDKPTFGLTEQAALAAEKRIADFEAEAVFSERLGPVSEKLSNAIAGTWAEFVVPYRRTPINLFSWAAQHIPGLNLLSGRWRDDYAAGGERQARAVARIVVGTAASATFFSLAEQGMITGSGLFDKEMGGTKRAAGWQANSFLIDGKYYSYARIEPIAKLVATAADLVELQKTAVSKEDKAKIGVMSMLLFGNATISSTYLSGLSSVLHGVTDPNRYAENLMESYASSLVPKIVGQTVGMTDPYKREVEGIVDAIQSQLPYFREKLLPKRDVWGEKVLNDRALEILPVAVTEASKDKVRTEAVRLAVAIADAPKEIAISGPFDKKSQSIELTPGERDIFRTVRGEEAMKYLVNIVNAPHWDQIPMYAQAAIYRDVLRGASETAAFKAMAPNDPRRIAKQEALVNKIIQQNLAAEGAAPPAPERRVK